MYRLVLLTLFFSSCSLFGPQNKEDLQKYLGKKVTIKGKAIDAHQGAFICVKNDDFPAIWVDGLQFWPEGYYKGDLEGKKVRVTGILIEKFDQPVFIQNDTIARHGIPMPEGTDLKKASQRYLLMEVKQKKFWPVD